jgi:hypothetical protein
MVMMDDGIIEQSYGTKVLFGVERKEEVGSNNHNKGT